MACEREKAWAALLDDDDDDFGLFVIDESNENVVHNVHIHGFTATDTQPTTVTTPLPCATTTTTTAAAAHVVKPIPNRFSSVF